MPQGFEGELMTRSDVGFEGVGVDAIVVRGGGGEGDDLGAGEFGDGSVADPRGLGEDHLEGWGVAGVEEGVEEMVDCLFAAC